MECYSGSFIKFEFNVVHHVVGICKHNTMNHIKFKLNKTAQIPQHLNCSIIWQTSVWHLLVLEVFSPSQSLKTLGTGPQYCQNNRLREVNEVRDDFVMQCMHLGCHSFGMCDTGNMAIQVSTNYLRHVATRRPTANFSPLVVMGRDSRCEAANLGLVFHSLCRMVSDHLSASPVLVQQLTAYCVIPVICYSVSRGWKFTEIARHLKMEKETPVKYYTNKAWQATTIYT